jgi:hypothetical protein
VDVPQGPGDDQARAAGGTEDVLADPEVPAGLADPPHRGGTATAAPL